jgi:hypothetical protein
LATAKSREVPRAETSEYMQKRPLSSLDTETALPASIGGGDYSFREIPLLIRFASVAHQFARSRTGIEASGEFLYARVGAEVGKLRIDLIVLKPST